MALKISARRVLPQRVQPGRGRPCQGEASVPPSWQIHRQNRVRFHHPERERDPVGQLHVLVGGELAGLFHPGSWHPASCTRSSLQMSDTRRTHCYLLGVKTSSDLTFRHFFCRKVSNLLPTKFCHIRQIRTPYNIFGVCVTRLGVNELY